MEAKKDRFAWFLAAALLLLGVDLLITARTLKVRSKRRILHTGAAGLTVALVAVLMPPRALAKGIDGKRVTSGNRYFENGEYQKALVLYKEALGDTTRLPGNAGGVLYNEANSLHMMGRYPEALEKYHQSLSEDTLQSGHMFYNRGNTLMKMGKPGEAVESYLQALRDIPDDLDARYNLELALRELEKQRQQQQQQNDEQPQDQNQDGKQRQGDKKDQPSGEQDQQNQQEQQNPADGQNQQEQQEQDQRNQQPQSATDSTQAQQPDSSMAQPQAADSTQTIELTREDALRLLRLLAEQEKELQKEKRKAAFKRSRGSGKDW
jgi:tetratricopeptide (TPR) repeat protein